MFCKLQFCRRYVEGSNTTERKSVFEYAVRLHMQFLVCNDGVEKVHLGEKQIHSS